eukprot:TRINITY_DN73660_c0_g1_i1.p1 TRINITY_DN73660_c0_g1~~TRINITY_DN73660_c0_g1_i1.p1  ORF type:complete len:335 (+),score=97.69 TRINITY_DN73660_c0_g1_i1:93-1097(+)
MAADLIDTYDAAELKLKGNEAYTQGDLQAAVDLWNQAIRRHVDAMKAGIGPSCLSEASRQLERSLYLNLAQGYLKLGDPAKALRACQVVIHENKEDSKARFRAAEACLQLKRFEEAEKTLSMSGGEEPPPPEVVKLRQRIRAARKAEADEAKKIAKRMAAGASGFSDDKPAPVEKKASSGPGHTMANLDTVAIGTDLAALAAEAAQAREKRMAAAAAEGGPPPVPAVHDTESFMAKALGRSQKYNAAIAKSRKQRETAQRSLKLDWLRSGRSGDGLEEFVSPLQAELRQIEVAAVEAERQEDEEGTTEEKGEEGEGREAIVEETTTAHGMEEMD